MTDRPLVSIIIPTWRRHALLLDTLANVREQTYPNIEVIVVSDGPDPALCHRLWSAGHRPADVFTDGGSQRLRLVECGRNWSTFLTRSFGVGPLMVGALLARGEYQMWLCDDERLNPDHVEALVDLIEERGVDFVYPTVGMWRPNAPDVVWMIGTDPPEFGQITSVLYRASVLEQGMYRFHIDNPPYPAVHDWDIVRRWMEAGATWALLERPTMTHRADHLAGDPTEQNSSAATGREST